MQPIRSSMGYVRHRLACNLHDGVRQVECVDSRTGQGRKESGKYEKPSVTPVAGEEGRDLTEYAFRKYKEVVVAVMASRLGTRPCRIWAAGAPLLDCGGLDPDRGQSGQPQDEQRVGDLTTVT